MMIDTCAEQNVGRRRIFWSTKPQVCGDYTLCGAPCSIPGLEYEDKLEGRTIKTDERLLGLILNILNTRARTDIRCPSPAGVFGHWSESYRKDGLYIGSTLWNAASKSYIRIADAVAAIEAAITADMAKLVALKVADTVSVKANYISSNRVSVEIEARTSLGRSRINLSGSFVTQSWVWH